MNAETELLLDSIFFISFIILTSIVISRSIGSSSGIIFGFLMIIKHYIRNKSNKMFIIEPIPEIGTCVMLYFELDNLIDNIIDN